MVKEGQGKIWEMESGGECGAPMSFAVTKLYIA